MIRKKSFIHIFLILIAFIFSINCSSSNTGTAQVTINLGFPNNISKVYDNRSQSRAPANIESIALTVTGSDMDTIDSTHTSDTTTITLDVLAGTEREFILSASVGAADPGVVLSYRGSTTSDLTAGETVSLTIAMAIDETKLVMPDFENSRIIQIDDITGTGSVVYSTDAPYDVDFDSLGRIYIARNDAVDGVIRIDDISGAGYLPISSINNIQSLTIDRNNNIVYFAISTALYRCNLDGTDETLLTIPTGAEPIQSIRGMAINESGILYIAIETTAGYRIFEYNPTSEEVTNVYNNANLNTPWDVLVKESYLYIANRNGANGYRIIQLDSNLSFVQGYGDSATSTDHNPGMFYGPRRFLAILNDKITIIDDYPSWDYDKLAQMDDINGTNWTTYPASGDGQTEFRFFYYSGC